MKTVIVIPTYNERENLGRLVAEIFSLAISDLSVLVVDDNSPDGTGNVAEELAKRFPVTVLHRARKEGLGVAYCDAFRHLLSMPSELSPDLIFEMDADLSHNPKDVPRFIDAIQTADVVLGSRYVSGGSIENWNVVRRMVSRFGNLYARIVLGLPYRDLTGGYKLFRSRVLKEIGISTLSSLGYNFQIETTYRAHQKGFKVHEIPIVFSERTTGKSKFNLAIFLESFWKVLALRFRR